MISTEYTNSGIEWLGVLDPTYLEKISPSKFPAMQKKCKIKKLF